MERIVLHLASGRGGEVPRAFGDDERVAAQDDGDMVVPTGKRAALDVVEAELCPELLGMPARCGSAP